MGEEIIVFFAFKANLSGIPSSFAGIKVCSDSLEELGHYAGRRLDHRFDEISKYVYEILDGKIWIGHCINQSDAPLLKKSFERIGKNPPKAKYTIDICDFLSSRKELALLASSLGLCNQCTDSYEVCRQNIKAINLFTGVMSAYEPDTLKNYADGDFHPMISYIRDVTAEITWRLSELDIEREKEVATNSAD